MADRPRGRQVFAEALADEFAHSTPNSDEAWQDAADSVLEALEEKELYLVYGDRLRALRTPDDAARPEGDGGSRSLPKESE